MKKKEEDKKAKKAQMKALTQGETASELQPPPEDQSRGIAAERSVRSGQERLP